MVSRNPKERPNSLIPRCQSCLNHIPKGDLIFSLHVGAYIGGGDGKVFLTPNLPYTFCSAGCLIFWVAQIAEIKISDVIEARDNEVERDEFAAELCKGIKF